MDTYSEALEFVTEAIRSLPRRLSFHGYDRAVLRIVDLAISSGYRFDIGDFRELSDLYYWPSFGPAGERSYSLACGVSWERWPPNWSAAASMEYAMLRIPFMAPRWMLDGGENETPTRVAVGTRLLYPTGRYGVDPWLTVTSLHKEYLIAVARPRFPAGSVWVLADANDQPLGCGLTINEARADAVDYPEDAVTHCLHFQPSLHSTKVVRRIRFTREELAAGGSP